MAEPPNPDSSETSELHEPARAPADGDAASVGEIRAWAGWRLDEIGGAGVGKVEGAFVDEQGGQPLWLLVRMGRFGHHTLIPSSDAVAGVGHVWVPYDRDMIRRAAKVEPRKPLTREQELELCAHYGIPEGLGRAAELSALPPGVASARPVS
jgi:hypothetical protein